MDLNEIISPEDMKTLRESSAQLLDTFRAIIGGDAAQWLARAEANGACLCMTAREAPGHVEIHLQHGPRFVATFDARYFLDLFEDPATA